MPVNLVNLESVSVAHGTTLLLDEVSLGIAAGDRVGVVGRNGEGKTTLLRVLARGESPDSGRVTHNRGLRLAVLSQADRLPAGVTVREVVLGEAATHEWAADARVREVLDGLGLHALGLEAGVDAMSGGERRRVALAALLVQRIDVLVLDEPTNHLDVEGVDWLARHLASRPESTALVVVTHDRWFLDAVCTDTWEVTEGRVHTYQGGYSSYVLAKAERERLAAAAADRRANLLRKELAWLRRGPPARSSKPRFRVAAAEELIAGEPPPRDEVALRRFASARLGKDVYDVEDVTVDVGDRAVLSDLTWRVGPGDRIAVVGVNGAGKTTLLRLLTGEVAPDGGTVRVGRTVRAAYLSQEVTESDPALRVLEAVEQVARVVDLGRGREITATQLAEQFGFRDGAQWTRVGDLSGGERRRLQLLRLLLGEPNVLLLDEPTNDLDVATLRQLEDVLDGWPGTLLVVSHDRYFLERVADRTVALLGDGKLAELPGGVDEYLRRRRRARATEGSGPAAGTAAAAGTGTAASAATGIAAPAGTAAGAAAPRQRAAETRAAKKELARLQRRLDKLERREGELHEELAARATDYEAVSELDAELRSIADEKSDVEERWLELADQV